MFKELVVFVHTAARNFLMMRPAPAGPRGSACRVAIKNSWWANIVFFIAIFTPLYVCLLQDVLGLLRDFNTKITTGK